MQLDSVRVGIAAAVLLALAGSVHAGEVAGDPAASPLPLMLDTGLSVAMATTSASLPSLRDEPGSPAWQGTQASPGGASSGDDGAELAKKLSNPVASLISVPFQFNYDTGYGQRDAERLTLNVQPVIPFEISAEWNLIVRTIVPVIYQGSLAPEIDSDTGMGDVLQSFFFSPKEPVNGWIFAAGPVVLWPTGTEPGLRSEQLGLGPTALALRQENGWTYGALVNHVWGVTHSDDHADVNSTFLQPFISYTWPTATTLTFNTESTYDWTAKQWTVPLNLTLGQVVRFGNQPVQFTLGARYYAESPDGGPEWGLRFVVTLLFPK